MIRKATAADVPAIRLLMETEAGFWQHHWSNDTVARAIESANGLSFVWDDGNEILGFVCAHDLGFRGYLSELIVAPNARGFGIGKALAERVQILLAKRGNAVLIADVADSNVRERREFVTPSYLQSMTAIKI